MAEVLDQKTESLVFHQKNALRAWRTALQHEPAQPVNDLEDLVWELLLLWSESSANGTDVDEDAQAIAYDIGTQALQFMGYRSILRIYRDAVVRAMMAFGSGAEQNVKRVVHFSCVIGDAYWQAYVDSLRRTIRQQKAESLSGELRVAKRIQQHLLPRSIPEIPGYSFAGRLVPAAEVGGDYWSVKYYDADDIVTMKLADVTGHGIAAATLVSAVKFISGGYYQGSKSAAWVIQKTNHVLVKETPHDILVSMFYGWLHPETHTLDIVNAGHDPIFICNAEGSVDIEPTGPVLGLAETVYEEKNLILQPGDTLFVCSDGLTEVSNGQEQFGRERVKEIVLENQHSTGEEIIDRLIQCVCDFTGTQYQQDDMSAVVVKRLA